MTGPVGAAGRPFSPSPLEMLLRPTAPDPLATSPTPTMDPSRTATQPGESTESPVTTVAARST
jgi:hypothetical protein